jgi:hypothetical protein
MTPAEILNAAADRIRDAGKKAGSEHDCMRESCAGWAEDRGPCGGCCSCLSGCVYDGPGDEDIQPGSWLDLLRPEKVARHLEALFRDAALAYELGDDNPSDEDALALAKSICPVVSGGSGASGVTR